MKYTFFSMSLVFLFVACSDEPSVKESRRRSTSDPTEDSRDIESGNDTSADAKKKGTNVKGSKTPTPGTDDKPSDQEPTEDDLDPTGNKEPKTPEAPPASKLGWDGESFRGDAELNILPVE